MKQVGEEDQSERQEESQKGVLRRQERVGSKAWMESLPFTWEEEGQLASNHKNDGGEIRHMHPRVST